LVLILHLRLQKSISHSISPLKMTTKMISSSPKNVHCGLLFTEKIIQEKII
jgi:hypothetical protein